jgi:hypothetical protein
MKDGRFFTLCSSVDVDDGDADRDLCAVLSEAGEDGAADEGVSTEPGEYEREGGEPL